YDTPGPLENTVFLRFVIINKGPYTLTHMHASLWSDPDLGGFLDDLVGVDVPRALGFVYNATNADAMYGAQVPSLGFDLLQGPKVSGSPLGMSAFIKYVNGTDPATPVQTRNHQQGLSANGSPIVDPITLLPTTYMI